jgi:hypothetical protein
MYRKATLAVILLAFLAGCGEAWAQRQPGPGPGPNRERMSHDERQRLREDMNSTRRDSYKDGGPQRQMPPHGGNRMSDAERDKLRRDMNDANSGMRRR